MDVNALGVFERRIFQTIFDDLSGHGVWRRRRMKHELAEVYGESNILIVVIVDPQLQMKQDLLEIGCLHGWEAAARDRTSWKIIVDRAMS